MKASSRGLTLCALAFGLVATVAGCGKTNRQAIEELAPRFAAKRQQLQSIAAQLPPVGSVTANNLGPLDPAMVFDRRNKTANVEFLMFDQLVDPDVNLRTNDAPDLLLSGTLLNCLQWTGPHNPMGAGIVDQHNGADLLKRCNAALDQRYLVVLRPAFFRRPVATSASLYTPGALALEVFVIDQVANNMRGYFHFNAMSAPTVEYTYRQGEDQQAALSRFAYSTLWSNARDQLVQLLQSTGARVDPREI